MNSRVVALADYRGTPRLAVGRRGVFLGQAAVGQHPPSVSAGTVGHHRGPWRSDLPLDRVGLSQAVLDVFSEMLGGGEACHLEFTRFTAVRSFVSYCQRNHLGAGMIPWSLIVSPAGTPRSDQSHPLPRPGSTLVANGTSTCGRRLCGGCCTKPPPGPGKSWRSTCGRPGPGAQTSRDHWQRRPQRIRVSGHPARRGSCQDIWLADAGGRCSSPFVAPTSSPPEETNAHTPAGEDCPMNAPPPFSNEQVVGGRSTNSATHPSLTSAKPGRPPSCSKPRADTKTLVRSLSTPNRETKQSQN